jgi:hypothetical protein
MRISCGIHTDTGCRQSFGSAVALDIEGSSRLIVCPGGQSDGPALLIKHAHQYYYQ